MNQTLKCPQCKSEKIIPILYGTPTQEELDAESWGELEISGSDFIEGVSPNRRCLSCGYQWHQPE